MSHTLTRIALVAAISGAGLATAAAESPMAPLAPASVPGTDLSTPNFVRIAAQTDEFERTAGRLAEKDGDAQVRKFGARMVRDHTKTTDEFKAAIRKAGMAVPPPPEMTTDQRQMLSELKGKTGATFDRVYLKQAVETHKQALGLMEAYAAHGDSAPIAHAAKGAVPIVTEHLRMAQRLAAGKPGEM